jgi:hypothetical protein
LLTSCQGKHTEGIRDTDEIPQRGAFSLTRAGKLLY